MTADFQERIDAQRLAHGRVRVDAAWLAERWLPRPLGMAFAVMALCSSVPWFGIVIAGTHDARQVVSSAVGSTYFCAAPSVALLLLPALAFAGSHGARALLCGLATLLAVAAGVGVVGVAGVMGDSTDMQLSMVLASMAGTPPLVGTVLFAAVAWWQGRRELLQQRAQRILQLLGHFGSLDLEQLEAGVGGDAHAALQLAGAQEALEQACGRVWTASRARAHKGLLLARLEDGVASVAGLAEAVQEPEEVVRAWLAAFQADEVLPVRVDGDVVVVEAGAEAMECSGCGGSMRRVGRGLWRCLHCGNEAA